MIKRVLQIPSMNLQMIPCALELVDHTINLVSNERSCEISRHPMFFLVQQ